jgi:hypothetical protein
LNVGTKNPQKILRRTIEAAFELVYIKPAAAQALDRSMLTLQRNA